MNNYGRGGSRTKFERLTDATAVNAEHLLTLNEVLRRGGEGLTVTNR